jgi:hypothetical protein
MIEKWVPRYPGGANTRSAASISMTSIDEFGEHLPPREYLPTIVRLLPELEYPPQCNLTDVLLDANLPGRQDKVAIYHETERLTYGELQSRVNRLANAMRELGIGPRDRGGAARTQSAGLCRLQFRGLADRWAA